MRAVLPFDGTATKRRERGPQKSKLGNISFMNKFCLQHFFRGYVSQDDCGPQALEPDSAGDEVSYAHRVFLGGFVVASRFLAELNV